MGGQVHGEALVDLAAHREAGLGERAGRRLSDADHRSPRVEQPDRLGEVAGQRLSRRNHPGPADQRAVRGEVGEQAAAPDQRSVVVGRVDDHRVRRGADLLDLVAGGQDRLGEVALVGQPGDPRVAQQPVRADRQRLVLSRGDPDQQPVVDELGEPVRVAG